MKLIDADALREHMYHEAFETDSGLQKWDSGLWIRYQLFESILNTEITIEAEPVRHGRWEWVDAPVFGNPYGSYKCDCCGNSMAHKTNYCPNCGARMNDIATYEKPRTAGCYVPMRKDEVTE